MKPTTFPHLERDPVSWVRKLVEDSEADPKGKPGCYVVMKGGRPKKGTLYVNGAALGPAEQYADGTIELGPHVTKRAGMKGSRSSDGKLTGEPIAIIGKGEALIRQFPRLARAFGAPLTVFAWWFDDDENIEPGAQS